MTLLAIVGATLNSCSRVQSQPQEIKIDGSSTVFPITNAIAKGYKTTQPNVKIQVNFT